MLTKSSISSDDKEDQSPIIGINGMRWPDGSEEIFTMDKTQIHYIQAVQKAGGIPITLPVLEDFSVGVIKKQVGLIDGLLIQGGIDVSPSLFGEEPKPELDITDIKTDKFILELIRQALKKKIPILGVCKGMQILNVAYGGTLYQDLKYAGLASDSHRQKENTMTNYKHAIYLEKNSLLGKLIPNKEKLYVNSYHHQAVKDLGKGFVIDAKSDDGIIESIHLEDENQWILGVQWHPEQLIRANKDFLPIFTEFINQANICKNKNAKTI